MDPSTIITKLNILNQYIATPSYSWNLFRFVLRGGVGDNGWVGFIFYITKQINKDIHYIMFISNISNHSRNTIQMWRHYAVSHIFIGHIMDTSYDPISSKFSSSLPPIFNILSGHGLCSWKRKVWIDDYLRRDESSWTEFVTMGDKE